MKKQTKLGLVLAAAAVISVSVASLVSAKGWVQQGADWYYVNNDGDYVTDTIQASGNSKFYLGEDGAMQRDYFLEADDKDNTYYFGSNGAMVTNTWVAIEASRVDSGFDNYTPDNYWYYFQASGKAMKGTSGNPKKATIDGKKYLFNENGQMVVGWVDSDGNVIDPDQENPFREAMYYCGGDNDGVLRAGWVTYYDGYDSSADSPHNDKTNLYFYFQPSNNKKIDHTTSTKKINGRSYTFDSEGVMLSGWDAYEAQANGLVVNSGVAGSGHGYYFSGEDDGHQVKKGWVYAVPSGSIDATKKNDEEEVYMYFDNSGKIVADQMRKVNGKYYVFNRKGVMKTGVVLWAPTVIRGDGPTNYHYINKLDLDFAKGEDVTKKGRLYVGDGKYYTVNSKGELTGAVVEAGLEPLASPSQAFIEAVGDDRIRIKLHFFGEDGARKQGTNNIEFADDSFSFYSNAAGDRGSGIISKKYYALGVALKANADIRMGIYVFNPNGSNDSNGMFFSAQQGRYYDVISSNSDAKYVVLNTSGSKIKGNNNAKKDADGNFWLIDAKTSYLKGIWTKNVKYSKISFTTKQVENIGANRVTGTTGISTARVIGLRALEQTGTADAGVTNLNTEGGWKATYAAEGNDQKAYVSFNADIQGYFYQSDFDGKTKWIPFGVYDDMGSTIVENSAVANGVADLKEYMVEPTNDYFLNCYWAE